MAVEHDANSPFADALAVWHMANLHDSSARCTPLTIHGSVTVGDQLAAAEADASIRRGGDGHTALFDGKSWLSAAAESVTLSPEEWTVCIRMRAQAAGGLLHTGLFSLLLHEDGLAVGFLGVEEGKSRMYRELLFSRIQSGQWHDLIVRYANGEVSFFSDGVLLNRIRVHERLRPVLLGPMIIGGWRIEDPPLPDFPEWIVDSVFQRLFTGAIDHAALWNRAITDAEVARLSETESVGVGRPDADWQRCLDSYHSFYSASRTRDVRTCKQLGLTMRQYMARDPRKPIYHLTAPMGWISDPAGAIYHNGQYHVFSYRNILGSLAFTPLDHYVGDDLIHWVDMPVAAWADSEYDVHGIWLANNVIDDDGTPSMLYTAHGLHGKIGVLASSADGLVSYGRKRVVITDPIHHDGHTWKDNDTWFTITTSQYWGRRAGDLGDGILLMKSADLRHWGEPQEMFSVRKHADPADDLQAWGFTEFPYLVPFGEKHVLLTGTRPVTYWVGRFDPEEGIFHPDESTPKLLDYLNPVHCFNPLTVDAKGPDGAPRRIVFAMHADAAGDVASLPWKGLHVLPRILTLENGRLLQEPVPEVERLRGRHHGRRDVDIAPSGTGFVDEVQGDALEIVATFEARDARRFGLRVRAAGDRTTSTKVFYDVSSGDFGVEGNVVESAYAEMGQGPAYLAGGDLIDMRVFLDKCLLEVFVNGHTCSGIFTGDPGFVGLDLFSDGGTARLVSLDVWEMKPAWPLSERQAPLI